jgi:hypothetical protein
MPKTTIAPSTIVVNTGRRIATFEISMENLLSWIEDLRLETGDDVNLGNPHGFPAIFNS